MTPVDTRSAVLRAGLLSNTSRKKINRKLRSNLTNIRRKFSFKCHRVDNKHVYPVNSIIFHPTYGTFSTGGGDGGIHFWDKDSKRSLKVLPVSPAPITAAEFNRNGSIMAYSIGNDWQKGVESPAAKSSIFLHPVWVYATYLRLQTTTSNQRYGEEIEDLTF